MLGGRGEPGFGIDIAVIGLLGRDAIVPAGVADIRHDAGIVAAGDWKSRRVTSSVRSYMSIARIGMPPARLWLWSVPTWLISRASRGSLVSSTQPDPPAKPAASAMNSLRQRSIEPKSRVKACAIPLGTARPSPPRLAK